MQEFSDNPPKKPAATVSIDDHAYLRAHVNNLLKKAHDLDAERDKIHDKIREYTRILRQKNGHSVWAPLVAAVSMCLVLVLVAKRQSTRDFAFTAPADKFQILKRFDAYHYEFRHVHEGRAVKDLPVNFCPNFEPQLSAGETLIWLHYMDLGRCWDILPEGFGYSFETTDGRHPTLAPNCFDNDATGLYECKPNKTEAIF